MIHITHPATLDQQAQQQFEDFLTEYFYKVTEGHLKEFISDHFTEVINPFNLPNAVNQINGMACTLKQDMVPVSLRPIIKWSGTITITARKTRSIPWANNFTADAAGFYGDDNLSDKIQRLSNSSWSPWKPFPPVHLILQYRNDAWSMVGLVSFHDKVSTQALNPVLLNTILLDPAI